MAHILGIETSCDETAAAVVSDGWQVRSSIVNSQVRLHAPYGGVVPEIASRAHVEMLAPVIERAVADSGIAWAQIDAMAVTYGPGLASSLLVGLAGAKALALRLRRPFYAVNHLEAHIHALFLSDRVTYASACPLLALVVSGGHTCLVRVSGPGQYHVLGQTVDDAAGEAFDKGASLLGLGYPGGPAIQKAAAGGDPAALRFPRGELQASRPGMGDMEPALCFSYSGLKTALRYYLETGGAQPVARPVADVAASYQEAVVDTLISRVERAIRKERYVSIGACGGVALNARLRERLQELAARHGSQALLSVPAYCADNAAMIAGLAGTGCCLTGPAAMAADALPNLRIRDAAGGHPPPA